MLRDFILSNRPELIARCQAKVAERSSAQVADREADLGYGVPLFLDQLIKTLQAELDGEPLQSRTVSGPAGGGNMALSEIGEGATQNGRELLRHGFTVDQVVHCYGDVCQAITDLAFELNVPFSTDEFRTLNRCLDNAIANAVVEFNYQHDSAIAGRHALEMNRRLGVFAHELRNRLATAMLALTVIKEGTVGMSGATGGVLDRSLIGLRTLIDQNLAEVRMTADMPLRHQPFSLADFIAEVKITMTLEAQDRGCTLIVAAVDPLVAIVGDRDLLFSALGNLLQNAFKFTHPQTAVTLTAHAVAQRVLIEVQDHCGGLSEGFIENMFVPFTQGSENQSGLGLGLSIARRSVEANGGMLHVRNLPGSGCIFTIDLPRHSLKEVLPSPLPGPS